MSALSAPHGPAESGTPVNLSAENTFGIELEFLLIYRHDCCPEDRGAYAAIVEVLGRHGIACQDEESLKVRQMRPHNVMSRYNTWRVTDDWHSLTDEQAEIWKRDLEHDPEFPQSTAEYYLSPIELVSRKFYYHRDDWQHEIRVAMGAILSLEQSPDFKLIVNAGCGFHVHVGNESIRVPLDTARELAMLVTAFEPQIDALHTADRVASWEHECMNKSPSYMHLVNVTHHMSVHELTMSAFLRRIDFCDTYAQLAEVFTFPGPRHGLFSDGKSSTYNFDQLFPDPAQRRIHVIRTIEFRQHSGTLDLPTILNWVHVVQAIFMSAQYHRFKELRDYSRDAGEQWSTIAMLRHMGVAPEVVMWYNAKLDPSSDYADHYYETQAQKFQENRFHDFFESLVGPAMVAMDPDEVGQAIEYKRRKWIALILEKTRGQASADEIAAALKP